MRNLRLSAEADERMRRPAEDTAKEFHIDVPERRKKKKKPMSIYRRSKYGEEKEELDVLWRLSSSFQSR